MLTDLPAYPDNVAAVGDGTYWIALPSPRLPIVERLLPHPGCDSWWRCCRTWCSRSPAGTAWSRWSTATGGCCRTLHGPTGAYSMITGVRQHGDRLWLGSLTATGVARVDLG